MTPGKLQLVPDAAEAGGHLCPGTHATHLARLHLLNPPITSVKPLGLQIKFLRKADIRPKEGMLSFQFTLRSTMQPVAGFSGLQKLQGK